MRSGRMEPMAELFLWDKYYCQYFGKDLRRDKRDFVSAIKELEVRDDDVWVVTLPKCGTTWMQELVWLILNDFDFETAKAVYLEERAPNLESDFYFNEDLSRAFRPLEVLKSPRLIKTHLPLSLLPRQLVNGKGKIVYVFRNPADALVSMYHHLRKAGFEMDISLNDSIRNYVTTGQFTEVCFDHAAEFYSLRTRESTDAFTNNSRVFYTSFECMKSNLSQVILNLCRFLNKPITKMQLLNMVKHLSFEEMQKNPKVQLELTFNWLHQRHNLPHAQHSFVRKGKVNSYKEELSDETALMLEKWIYENLAKRHLKLDELLLLNA